jgi:dTDP-4-amino-4,6-dideoxygalactose transaminase
VGILSFNQSKTLTGGSSNGGGALIVSNATLGDGIAERVARLPEGKSRLGYYIWFALRHGIEITPRALSEYIDPIDEVLRAWFRVDHKSPERMSAAAAYAVAAQLDRLSGIVRSRGRIIGEYAQILRNVPELQLAQGATYATLTRIVVRWRSGAAAADVREKMTRQGFATRLAYPHWTDEADPVTAEIKRIGATHLELPAAPSLQRKHLEQVVRSLVPLVSG